MQVKINDIVQFKMTILTTVLEQRGIIYNCKENHVDIQLINNAGKKQKVFILNVPKKNLKILKRQDKT